MNKNLKKIFCMLFIVPLICLCFAGCNAKNEEKIVLTTDNISKYLVVSYYFSSHGDSTQSEIVTIETSKRINNIEFFDCEIQISSKKSQDSNSNNSCVCVDFNGKSKHSYIENYVYNNTQLIIEITSVTGYVILTK